MGANPNGNWGYAEGARVGITIYALWRYTHLLEPNLVRCFVGGGVVLVVVFVGKCYTAAHVVGRKKQKKKKH